LRILGLRRTRSLLARRKREGWVASKTREKRPAAQAPSSGLFRASQASWKPCRTTHDKHVGEGATEPQAVTLAQQLLIPIPVTLGRKREPLSELREVVG
jgi:hypothetical protein